ncbi:MAG: cyclophilin-like fold protein [Burkholderiales bacterium]
MSRIRVEAGAASFEIELDGSATSLAILQALPFESSASTWGEEVYFSTPVSAKLEANARQVVEPGTVCFWTQGDALALPWGRTPISTDDKPKLANPCSVLGKIVGDFLVLKKIKSGDRIKVSAD